MDKLTIRVQIGDRYYPVNIERSDEELFRKAVKEIHTSLTVFKERFSHKDTQDLLSMTVLQAAVENLKYEKASEEINTAIDAEFSTLNEQLDSILSNQQMNSK